MKALLSSRGAQIRDARTRSAPRAGDRPAGCNRQDIPARDPLAVVTAELDAFLSAVATRRPQGPGLIEGGVAPLAILDAARRSAHEGRVVEIEA